MVKLFQYTNYIDYNELINENMDNKIVKVILTPY